MKESSTPLAGSLAVLMCALTLTTACSSPQPEDSTLQFERGFPTAVTAQNVYDATDLRRAIEAYKFFFGTMQSEAVMQQMLSNGAVINEVGHVMATSPLQQFAAANADTPYALTTVDLTLSGPMVVEIPAGPYIGFVDDHNMRWVLDMGIIGPDKGNGGKHLILPPDYEGEVPSGYYVGRSQTRFVVVFVRIMPIGGDVAKAIESAIRQSDPAALGGAFPGSVGFSGEQLRIGSVAAGYAITFSDGEIRSNGNREADRSAQIGVQPFTLPWIAVPAAVSFDCSNTRARAGEEVNPREVAIERLEDAINDRINDRRLSASGVGVGPDADLRQRHRFGLKHLLSQVAHGLVERAEHGTRVRQVPRALRARF